MKTIGEYKRNILAGLLDTKLTALYGSEDLDNQQTRYLRLIDIARDAFDPKEVVLVSSPGRTELGGNHTDHNHGHVLAAAVNLDCVGLAAQQAGNKITLLSEGMDPIEVGLFDLQPQEDEKGTSAALIRGVAAGLSERGRKIGGFSACVTSTIPAGAGLSSSAAFSLLVANIFNSLFNDGALDTLEMARVAKYAENVFFGKPCGFMDQIASAFQGVVHIDFEDLENPTIEQLDVDFSDTGYALAVVNTGGSHADLTPDYAAIPGEMADVCKALNVASGRELYEGALLMAIPELRKLGNDRAILRMMHFISENDRVLEQVQALRDGNIDEYLQLVKASGLSSQTLLQNCATSNPAVQPIPVALALAERALLGQGVCRVHGGGFAGTIQVYVPETWMTAFGNAMIRVFGDNAVSPLRVRKPGIVAL